jgi:hypothetical protein
MLHQSFIASRFNLEATSMTRLPPSGAQLPICLHETSAQDRKTYRKWMAGCCVCYFLLIAGFVAVGLSTSQSRIHTAAGAQTTGMGETRNVAAPAR